MALLFEMQKTLATEKNAEKMFLGTHTIQIKPKHIWMQH